MKTQAPDVADFDSFIDALFAVEAHSQLVEERNANENVKASSRATSNIAKTSSNASNGDAPLSDNVALLVNGRDEHTSNIDHKENNLNGY